MNSKKQYHILVKALRIRANHGVYKEEKIIGNTFEFNLKIGLDMDDTFHSDHIVDTVDYVSLIELIKKENKQRSNTLEHLGGRITHRIFEKFRTVNYIHLRVEKIDPPVSDELKSVGIEIEEYRSIENG